MHDFIEVDGENIHIYPHEGQVRALQSDKRIICVVSGSQGGKTSLGPCWLTQEISRKGPGTYLTLAPTFTLLELSAIPKSIFWMRDCLKLGRYVQSPSRRFEVSDDGARRLFGHAPSTPTTIRFSHASNSDAVEAVTASGAWLDECGQKEFAQTTWQNIYTRRLAVNKGRVLLSSTPYSCDGWYRDLVAEGEAGAGHIDVIRFDSTKNPAFSMESWEEAKRTLPTWRFEMMFKGVFSRPFGQIYDCFDDKKHLIKPFAIPDDWPRFLGMDFGGVNTAGVFLAQGQGEYSGKYILYRAYHRGGLTAAGHVAALLSGEPSKPIAYGGAGSEDQFRAEFTAASLRINKPPIHEVEVGISRVYASLKTDQLLIFDNLKPLITELRSYSRKVSEDGLVLEDIENKSSYHLLDSTRYIVSHLRHPDVTNRIIRPAPRLNGGFA